jgi:hypothetical protein
MLTMSSSCSISCWCSIKHYADQYPEQPLLAFVMNETNHWLCEIFDHNYEAESDKFVNMASMNLVNFIASAPATLTAHG